MSEQLGKIEALPRKLTKVQKAQNSKLIAEIILAEDWADRVDDSMLNWEIRIDNSHYDYMGIIDPRLGIMWAMRKFADVRVNHRVKGAVRHYRDNELEYINQALLEAHQAGVEINLGSSEPQDVAC